MRARIEQSRLKGQIAELLEEHFENGENPHMTIHKISTLLHSDENGEPVPHGQRLH
jgi:hypothetical protein